MSFEITVSAKEVSDLYLGLAEQAEADADLAEETADLVKQLRQGQGQSIGFEVSAPEIRSAALEVAAEYLFIAGHAHDPALGDSEDTYFKLSMEEARSIGLLAKPDKPLGVEARSIGYVRQRRGR